MRKVAIIGGGPAAMLAAYQLSSRYEVHLYEKKRNIGRKFLIAGEGGFNLTNALEGEALFKMYSPVDRMRPILQAFGPSELRDLLLTMGIPTYRGSSGRVFPERGIKPIQVLDAIRGTLEKAGVMTYTGHEFVGFDEGVIPIIEHQGERVEMPAERYYFALGGASWPSTGSTGNWADAFKAIGVKVEPFRPSNCGVEIDMPETLRIHAGRPLKNVSVSCNAHHVRGECLITQYGLEGNAIYPLIPCVRDRLESGTEAKISIDLKPDISLATITQRLLDAQGAERIKAMRLDRPALALFKASTAREVMRDPLLMARSIKDLQIAVRSLRPLEEAISTVGGITWDSLAADLSIQGHPHLVVMGEMIDWDAPTGGFLLQGAFSTGHWAAEQSP